MALNNWSLVPYFLIPKYSMSEKYPSSVELSGDDGGYPSGNGEFKGVGGLVACVFCFLFVSHRVLENLRTWIMALASSVRVSAALDIVLRSWWFSSDLVSF